MKDILEKLSVTPQNDSEVEAAAMELTGLSGRREFQQFIHSRLAAMIPYSACSFFLIDENARRMENFLSDPVMTGLDPAEVLKIEGSSIFLRINSGKELLGYCVVIFPPEIPKEAYLKQLEYLLPHFSSAISRIKIIEGAEEVKRNFEILEIISAELVMNKDKDEVLKALRPHLKTFFNFSHHFVAGINPDQLSLSLLLQDLDSAARSDSRYMNAIESPFAISEGLVNKVLFSNEPILFDLEYLASRKALPEFMAINYEYGISKMVMVSLHIGGERIGIWTICLSGNEMLSPKQLAFIKVVSRQISIAARDFQLAEAIREKKMESDFLTQVSAHIAMSDNKNDLKLFLTQVLRKKFVFEDVALLTIDESGTYQPFLESSPGYSGSDILMLPLCRSRDLYIYDMEQLVKAIDTPQFLKDEYHRGIRTKVGFKLQHKGAVSGALFFNLKDNSFSDKDLELLSSIALQLSTAISTILSNQAVDRLMNIRSQLLQFGMNLRMAKDEGTLSTILAEQLKTLFQAENFLVTALSADGKSHRALFFDPESELASFPEMHSWSRNFEEIGDGFFTELLSAEDVIYDKPSLLAIRKLPRFIKFLAVDGMDLVGSVIKLADEPVGMVFFQQQHPSKLSSDSELFSSIRSQIAIVIVNLLSQQKIQLQLKEIEGYKNQLEEEKTYLSTELKTAGSYTEIVGQSPALKDSFHLVSQVSASESTVLILGETGTGKELIARAIHNNSPRKNKLMIKVNCAALPANLIESELFGHERGSFTGATDRRIGKFELAQGGTLFLDEIGEMPLDLQVKLLRALQEKEVERVGGRGTIKVDVRIIAATNRDLLKEMEEGRFRSDLYYRLNIFPICLPPLRERKEDIELLVYHFIKHYSKKCGKEIDSISSKALQDLQRYNWPGNVRELEHLIERSVLLASGNVIKQVLLPASRELQAEAQNEERDILRTIDQNEKEHIYRVLQYSAGRIAGKGGAAEILGVPPTTLNSKIKRLGIKRGHSI